MANVEQMREYIKHLVEYDDPEEIKEWLFSLDTEVLTNLRMMLFTANADVRTELRKRGIDTQTYYFSQDKEPMEDF